jgi:hypothetical protein
MDKHQRYYQTHRDVILHKKKQKNKAKRQHENSFFLSRENLEVMTKAVGRVWIHKPTMIVYCEKEQLFVCENF